jgi:small ligand-binding sensory domain FIST
MIHAASALVRDVTEPRAAIAAAVHQSIGKLGGRPEAAVVFATPHFRSSAELFLETLRGAGCGTVVGGCASGVLTEDGECEGGRALAVLAVSGATLHPFHVPPSGSIRPQVRSGSVAVFLPDPLSVDDLSGLVRDFDGAGEFLPVVGGAISGGEKSGHFLFAGDRIVANGTAGIVLDRGTWAVGIASGCRPIGKPLVITKCQGHVVLALAGRPPMEVLQETLKEHANSEGGPGGPVMAGIALDASRSPLKRGDFLVRNMMAVKSEQGTFIAVGMPVRVGQTLEFHLMDRAGAEADMKEMVRHVKEGIGGTPSFGLYFNCRGRGKHLFGQTDHETGAIRAGLGGFPLAGFFGNAELAPVGRHNWVHNYTGVLLAVR